MARRKNLIRSQTIELQLTPKLVAYLDDLVRQQAYGDTRQEVIKRFVWDGVQARIKGNGLKPR